jgi:hypothetical protein
MKAKYEQNEFMFHMVFSNNFISRTDILNPLKTDNYHLNGLGGIMLEYEDENFPINSLFLSYNTAEVIDQRV